MATNEKSLGSSLPLPCRFGGGRVAGTRRRPALGGPKPETRQLEKGFEHSALEREHNGLRMTNTRRLLAAVVPVWRPGHSEWRNSSENKGLARTLAHDTTTTHPGHLIEQAEG